MEGQSQCSNVIIIGFTHQAYVIFIYGVYFIYLWRKMAILVWHKSSQHTKLDLDRGCLMFQVG